MDFEWMVADEFGALTGLSSRDRLPYLPLCISSAQQIKSRLKPDVKLKEHAGILCTAAASIAFYRYVLLRTALDEGSFSAGDLSVTKNSGAQAAAEHLKENALSDISHLLEDHTFVFRQVM